MRLSDTINFLKAYGTTEGAVKGWDVRGRGRAWDGYTPTKDFFLDPNGNYTPDRIAIHRSLIRKYEHKPTQADPTVHVILGGTASGKTSLANRKFGELRTPAIVNMDKPRSDLPEFQKVVGTEGTGLLQEEASDIRDQLLMSAMLHNTDIALDAVGSPGLAQKIDDLEKSGYKVKISYVHSPIDQALDAAETRSRTAQDPADRRIIPPEVTRASHEKSRGSLAMFIKPGRDIEIYDRSAGGAPVRIYHRGADGKTDFKDSEALERMRTAKGERSVPDVFAAGLGQWEDEFNFTRTLQRRPGFIAEELLHARQQGADTGKILQALGAMLNKENGGADE